MTSVVLRRDNRSWRGSLGLIGVAASTALVLATPAAGLGTRAEWVLLALILAACVPVQIELTHGSPVSIVGVAVVAYAVTLTPLAAAAVLLLGLLAATVWMRMAAGERVAISRGHPWAVLAAGSAAIAADAVVRPLIDPLGLHGDVALLTRVLAAGVAYVGVELLWRGLALRAGGRSVPTRWWAPLLGVELAVLCTAALMVLASRQLGPVAALAAAAPLLVIQYSFARYARARQTYDQAIRALGVVPEVAGHVSFGHGERCAVYAAALCRAWALDRRAADLVDTAARIHHVGEILADEGPYATAAVLGEVGFLAGVADLVAAVERPSPDRTDLAAAVVRVSCAFDLLVGEDPARVGRAAEELLTDSTDALERSVVERLVRLTAADQGLVRDAIRQGRYVPLPHVAAGVDAPQHDHDASCR